MPHKRERVARMLDAAGILNVVLRARARTGAPVLTVLCYHSIGTPGDDYKFDPAVVDVSGEQLRGQLEVLRRHCTVVDVDQVCAALRGDRLPPNSVLITFDDGYRSCVEVALPILRDYGFTAAFFVATSYVQNRRLYWWDRIHYVVKHARREQVRLEYPRPLTLDITNPADAAGRLLRLIKEEYDLDLGRLLDELTIAAGVPWSDDIEAALVDELIMTWDHVRALRAAGMDIGSHTRSHRVLQTLSHDALTDELTGSRTDLERELGQPVAAIAYPVGYDVAKEPRIRQALESAGYAVGFTNASGVNYMWRSVDRFDVRRLAMNRDASLSMFRGQLAIPGLAHGRAG